MEGNSGNHLESGEIRVLVRPHQLDEHDPPHAEQRLQPAVEGADDRAAAARLRDDVSGSATPLSCNHRLDHVGAPENLLRRRQLPVVADEGDSEAAPRPIAAEHLPPPLFGEPDLLRAHEGDFVDHEHPDVFDIDRALRLELRPGFGERVGRQVLLRLVAVGAHRHQPLHRRCQERRRRHAGEGRDDQSAVTLPRQLGAEHVHDLALPSAT